MTPIEQLAIEHGSTCYTGQEYHFDKSQLEAFAKAYAQQSSEPRKAYRATMNISNLTPMTNIKQLSDTINELKSMKVPSEWILISPDLTMYKGDIAQIAHVVIKNHPLMNQLIPFVDPSFKDA